MLTTWVGPEQYNRLLRAIDYYERHGFKYINVPWCVSEEAMMITRPEWAKSSICTLIAGGEPTCPVASAEQSFLQLQIDAIGRGERMAGKYVAITPCFRNEPVLDDLHQAYFMKVELIHWGETADGVCLRDVYDMVNTAQMLLNCHVPTIRVVNEEPDPVSVGYAFDINAKSTGIELGSYGIREYPAVGRWVYGTGLAEPRMTYAIEKDTTVG